MNELPRRQLLRRGDICRHFGLTHEEFADLVAAEVFNPVYVTIPRPERLSPSRQKRLPKQRYAHFQREEVLAAEAAGRIVCAREKKS